jgi:hypothetical protein
MKFIAIGGVVLLLLSVAKGLFPIALYFLPLGGSSIAEMGIVLGLATAVATIADMKKGKSDAKASDHHNN